MGLFSPWPQSVVLSGKAGASARRVCRSVLHRTSQRGDRREVATKVQCGSEGGDAGKQPDFVVRRAKKDDAPEIAALCSEAFPYTGLQQQLAWAVGLRPFFPPRSTDQWQQQIERAFDSRADAARRHMILRTGGWPVQDTAGLLETQVTADRVYLQRQIIRRSFFSLAAVDQETGALLGALAASLARPQAFLPPPFPTQARLQFYVSNVAVWTHVRRQGVATALLAASERLAARWGHDSVWLHVERSNTAAVQLYSGLGYTTVRGDPKFIPGSALVMAKAIQPVRKHMRCTPGARGPALGGTGVGGQTRDEDGVFVWEVPGSKPEK